MSERPRVARTLDSRRVALDRSARPPWLRVRMHATPEFERVQRTLAQQKLNTVCQSAACPNLGECWARGTATFMIGGSCCTRRCGFCAVTTARPENLDSSEPDRVARAASELGLRFAVITCVARDDLADGGAGQMAATIRAIRARCSGAGVEVLISDYRGDEAALGSVLDASPQVLNHNIETVERLQRRVRPAAGYQRSLLVLRRAGELHPEIPTKSGLMVGLGERDDEIEATLGHLREAGVTLLTLGQYLRPSAAQLPVSRYLPPGEFDLWEKRALAMGFRGVVAGPLARSSYHSEKLAGRLA